MLLKFKRILFLFLITVFLLQIPTFAVEKQNLTQVEAETQEDYMTPDTIEEESISTTPLTGEIDARSVKSPYENDFQEKLPEQNEFTKVVFMFLKVMLAVIICSVIIFLLLLGVRKFYGVETPVVKTTVTKKIEDNLKSTKNENEALQIFFNKTKNL